MYQKEPDFKDKHKTKPKKMNVIEDTLEEPVANPVNMSDDHLRCSGACYALQKTFSHKDELNLHMEFYHVEQAKASSQ